MTARMPTALHGALLVLSCVVLSSALPARARTAVACDGFLNEWEPDAASQAGPGAQ